MAAETALPVRLSCIGVPRVRLGEAEVRLPVRKTLALFVFLALAGRSPRQRLAELLWGGLDEPTARRNLRRAVHRLRAAGLGDVLEADDDFVSLRGVACDLDRFRAALGEGRLAEACAFGDEVLCAGLELDEADDSAGFDEWLQGQRERFARERRDALERHATERERAGDLRAALTLQHRLLADDPLREATYRELMRLHDAVDERTAALDLYGRCERVLREELRLEPLPQTRLLAERIRRREAASASEPASREPSSRAAAAAKGFDPVSVPLVARERELAAIAARREAVVLVLGEAGVGKSRLAIEAAHARRRAAGEGDAGEVAVVRFAEATAATPFRAVADALRMLDDAGRLGPLAAATRIGLAPLLPAWRDAATGVGESAPEPRADADASPATVRALLLASLADALDVAAGKARTLVFDDLHWADASSLELLGGLARRRGETGSRGGVALQIIATARESELAASVAATAVLDALAATGELARIAVAPFDDWSMLQLVQRLSSSEGGVRFAARLVAATGGNPFFALETIRDLLESGELRIEPGLGWSTRYDGTTEDYAEMPLPSSVLVAVRARIARLGAAAERVLEAAALAEDGSPLPEIQSATALTDWEALQGLEQALADHVITRAGSGYRFSHDLFRSALLAGLSPERQAVIHARLAQALEPLPVAPARIARHWERAGHRDAAHRAWVRAAEAAVAVHAHREAIDHYGRAAELAESPEAQFELHDLRMFRMIASKLEGEREGLLPQMLALAERSGSSALMYRALMRAAEIAIDDGRLDDGERLALRALREFEPPDGRRHLAGLMLVAYAVADQPGRLEEAFERWTQALEVAERREPRSIAFAAASAVNAAVDMDRLDQADALRQRALAALVVQESTPPLDRPQVLLFCAFVPRARGDRAAALSENAEAIAMVRRLRVGTYEAVYLANQCEMLVDDGRLEEAREAHADSLAAWPDRGLPFSRLVAAATAVPIHALAGQLGLAVASAEEAIAMADEMGAGNFQRDERLWAARLLGRLGADDDAAALARDAQAYKPPGAATTWIAAENIAAAGMLAGDPAGAEARLRAALAKPRADRLLHPHIATARVLLGRCALARKDAEAARDAVAGLRYSTEVEAEALAVRIDAAILDGKSDPASVAQAQALLEGERVPPLGRLVLMRSLADQSRREKDAWRGRMAAIAQSLADSLRERPALQAAFIRRHRDLLT